MGRRLMYMETTDTMWYIGTMDGRELVRIEPRLHICLVTHKRAGWRKDWENRLQDMLVVYQHE